MATGGVSQHDATPLVDRRLEVETPERVAVGFELAGPGSRFAAFVLDAIVLLSLLVATMVAFIYAAGLTGTAGPVLFAGAILLSFGIGYGYFILFEGVRDGQTPGKKLFSLRVVQEGGYPVTLRGAAIRNLIRLVDIQPFPTCVIGGSFILFHPRAQRLGDLAAGTVVVRERPARLVLYEDDTAAGPPRLTDEEYGVLRQYVLRRDTLERDARARVAGRLAVHLRAHAEPGPGDADADAVLRRLYARESARRTAAGVRAGTGSPAAAALASRQRDRWTEYRALLDRARTGRLASLPEADVARFAALYREVAADLARARTYGASQDLVYTLERLVAAGHNLLYTPPRRSWRRVLRWFRAGFPALVRRRAAWAAAASVLLFGPGLASFAAVAVEPGRARIVLPAEMLARAEEGAQRAQAGRGYVEVPPIAMPIFSSTIIANNVQVSFFAFAGGVVAGLGTVLILILNGIALGAATGLFHAEGLNLYLWSFILPHGVLELTAICLAGAAGLLLGSALVMPGRVTRAHALVVRGREAISLLAGVVVLLFLAGLIEGFISPAPVPAPAKLAFGALTGLVLFAYLALAGRAEPEGETPPSMANTADVTGARRVPSTSGSGGHR